MSAFSEAAFYILTAAGGSGAMLVFVDKAIAPVFERKSKPSRIDTKKRPSPKIKDLNL